VEVEGREARRHKFSKGWGEVLLQVIKEFLGHFACSFGGIAEQTRGFAPSHLERVWDNNHRGFTGKRREKVTKMPGIVLRDE